MKSELSFLVFFVLLPISMLLLHPLVVIGYLWLWCLVLLMGFGGAKQRIDAEKARADWLEIVVKDLSER